MREFGYIEAYPMHCRRVDGKLIIVAGHHRLNAAKRLGIPVCYVICTDTAEIWQLEQSTIAWKATDFVTSMYRAGNAEVHKVIEYSKRTGIPISQSASVMMGECAGSSNAIQKIKRGIYTTKPNQSAEQLAGIVMALSEAAVPCATNNLFVESLHKCILCSECDVCRLQHKLTVHSGKLRKMSTLRDYLTAIEDIYNMGNHGSRFPLAFMANEDARKRSRANING
jgi:hypothetical protein